MLLLAITIRWNEVEVIVYSALRRLARVRSEMTLVNSSRLWFPVFEPMIAHRCRGESSLV